MKQLGDANASWVQACTSVQAPEDKSVKVWDWLREPRCDFMDEKGAMPFYRYIKLRIHSASRNRAFVAAVLNQCVVHRHTTFNVIFFP